MIRYHDINIPVFSIPPDWGRGIMRVAEKFGDKIFEALSTAEERHGTQPRSLFTVNFDTMTMSEHETGFIRKAIEAAGDMPIALPLWPGQCRLTADAVAGNSFVYCDETAGGFFDLVPFCILWKDYDVFETFRTFAIGANAVQFDRPITGDFEAGDLLVPMIVGKFTRDAPTAMTDTFGEFPVKFEEKFVVEGYAEPFAIVGTDLLDTLYFTYELIGGEMLDQFARALAPDGTP